MMRGIHVKSMDQAVVLSPHLRTIGYRAIDESTADIYLSDIPLDRLAATDSLDDLTGSIIELHMFVNPKPGKTPIETTASSVTIRQVILAGGQIGLYGGGGFLFPNGSPGDTSFGGRIKHGSVRLLAATAGFRDRLGAAEFDAGVMARKDAAATAIMSHVFKSAVHVATQTRSASSQLPEPAAAGEP